MNELTNLLKRFEKHIQDGEELDRVVSLIIKQKTGVDISCKALTVRDGVIRLSTHPAVKQEIILKKDLILKDIAQKLPQYNVIDLL